jgi:hypothetical protein
MAKNDSADPSQDTTVVPDPSVPADTQAPAVRVITMLDGSTRPIPTGAGYIVRNVARSFGHFLDHGVNREVGPGEYVILDYEPRALSVELQVQQL